MTLTDLSNSIAAKLLSEPRRLAIVFYHVDQPAGHPLQSMQGPHLPDYHAVIAKSVAAAKTVHPEALIVMLTDERTVFDTNLPITVIPLPVISEWVIYERSRAQGAFAQVWDAPALHIDTDVILCRRFDRVFAEPMDIGAPFRMDSPGMPIKGGMLLCKNPGKFARFMTDLASMQNAIAEDTKSQGWERYDLRCFRSQQMALSILLHSRVTGLHKTHWGVVGIMDANAILLDFDPRIRSTSHYAWDYKGFRKSEYLAKPTNQPTRAA